MVMRHYHCVTRKLSGALSVFVRRFTDLAETWRLGPALHAPLPTVISGLTQKKMSYRQPKLDVGLALTERKLQSDCFAAALPAL
jgi:hypothetical protein